MAGNRKAATELIVKWINEIDPSGQNGLFIEERLNSLTQEQFHAYMQDLKNEKDYVSIIAENLSDTPISIENNHRVAKKMGHEFFQRIWTTDPITGDTYLTNQKYLIIDLPARRQIQTLENKLSVPEDNKHIDEMTNQPTGASKGSSISFPELLVLHAQGQQAGPIELIKYRGGDEVGMRLMNQHIFDHGEVKLDTISQYGTKVKSTVTVNILFKGMHLDNNF